MSPENVRAANTEFLARSRSELIEDVGNVERLKKDSELLNELLRMRWGLDDDEICLILQKEREIRGIE